MEGKITEYCAHCGNYPEITPELKAQKCPYCGAFLIPCSLCDCDTCDCANCELSKKCEGMNNGIIFIDGVTYFPISAKEYGNCVNSFDICDKLKCHQYAPYYNKYIYKLTDGTARAVYQDDLQNSWEI